jgi:hypothetical protein
MFDFAQAAIPPPVTGVKTMKYKIFGVLVSLMMAGCAGIMDPPENGEGLQNGPAGNLTVRIGYSLTSARTVYPVYDSDRTTPLNYVLEFSAHPAATHEPVSASPGVPVSIRLETGSWTVTAKAMAGAVEKASGTWTGNVTANGNVPVAIALSPVGGTSTGTLAYTLYFPAGTTGSLTLENSGGSSAGSESSFTSGTEGTIDSLAPGSYLVKVSLGKDTETAGRTEAVHIVAGLATKVAYNFYEDLASAPTPVTSAEDLAKIGVDAAWPLSDRYVLAQDLSLTDWTPLGSLADPFAGSFDGGGHTITINSFSTEYLENKQYIGIFAAVKGIPENKARVKNLNIVSSVSIAGGLSASQGQGIGLVTGYAEDAVISGVNLSGSLSIAGITKATSVGGIAGDMRRGAELRNCASAMDLSVAGAISATGGLAGSFLTSANGSEYGEGRDALVKDCVNSGKVEASPSGSDVTVGGIAGGSKAGAAYYLGRIEDCAYTGTLKVPSGSTHSVGGIAGAIGGNGGDAANGANTSRILRCRVTGSISYSGSGSNAGAGGIAGTATNGVLVARCSSSAAITGPGNSSGSTGGIAGILNAGARISDCWSDGTVKGGSLVGGIATGTDTVGFTIERCYSRAAVVLTAIPNTWGLGGICGKTVGTGATVTLCVALNDGIISPGSVSKAKRIFGNLSAPATVAMNYAPAIPVTGTGTWTYDAKRDGTLLEDDPPEQWLYEVTLGWDFDKVWIMGSDGYPLLRGVDSN